MIYLAGIIITFFLAIILLSKKGKTAADYVLSAWLCIMGFHLLLFYLHITGKIFERPYLLGIQVPMPLLHGPLLYIYTLTVTRYNGFSKKYWLHFIPAAVAYLTLSKFFLLTGAEKITVYKNNGAGYEIYSAIILIAAILSGFVYVFLSFLELREYRKRITEEFSNTEKINLNWLRYLVFGILVIWVIILLDGGDPLIFAAVVVFIFLLGYFGIKHTGIFSYREAIVLDSANSGPMGRDSSITDEKKNADLRVNSEDIAMATRAKRTNGDSNSEKEQAKIGRTKYEKSGLQKEAADKIYQELNLLMKAEKVFKKEELSLGQLAQQLGVHPNNLSQVVNTYENRSFYDYINHLRIEEFKSLVSQPENNRYTLLSLAFECGFNSKTAFNRNFKKMTGKSPSEYLKCVNVVLSEDE